jgi:hypothetical protein
VLSIAGVLYGADLASTGLLQLWYGVPQATLLNQALQGLGLSVEAANYTELAIGLGVGGAGMVRAGMGAVAKGDSAITAGAAPKAQSLAWQTGAVDTELVTTVTGSELNATSKYTQPSWNANESVSLVTLKQDTQFVRVYNAKAGARQAGSFMARTEDMVDASGNLLSPAAIQQKFSLPYQPNAYAQATIPAGTRMYTGTTAPIPAYGTSGGGMQWQIQTQFERDFFESLFSGGGKLQ